MFRSHKKIIAIICFIMFVTWVPGCRQQQESQQPTIKEPIQDAVVSDFSQKQTLNGITDEESSSQQESKASEVQFSFYPSGEDFVKSVIEKRGNVEITDEMRERFNLFARDYRFFYMPDMNYYDSFFDANEYAKSFGYNNFGFAVFYVLSYMRFPEKMSAESIQNTIQRLFVDENSNDYESNYKDMPHQAYRKLANYEDGYYSPWPEGGLDHDRMFYLLTGLNIEQEGSDVVNISVSTKSYYFNDPGYVPGENEEWLAEKSKKLGISDMQAATELIKNGEMAELKGDREYKIVMRIKFTGNNPYGYNPRFVSSECHDITE